MTLEPRIWIRSTVVTCDGRALHASDNRLATSECHRITDATLFRELRGVGHRENATMRFRLERVEVWQND